MATVSTGLRQRINLLFGKTTAAEILAILDANTAQTVSQNLKVKCRQLVASDIYGNELIAILGGNEANVSVGLRRRLRLALADEPTADEAITLLEAIDITTVAPTTAAPTTAAPTTAAPTTAAPTTVPPTTTP